VCVRERKEGRIQDDGAEAASASCVGTPAAHPYAFCRYASSRISLLGAYGMSSVLALCSYAVFWNLS
jgi:hypothetical protein